MGRGWLIVVLWLGAGLLMYSAGGVDPYGEQTKTLAPLVQENITQTRAALTAGSLSNAVILKEYATQLALIKPELSALGQTLAMEATPQAAQLKVYEQQLNALTHQSANSETADDIKALRAATLPDAYNDALLDPINTLADLSEKKLPRLSSPRPRKQEAVATQLVGNPTYGQWQRGNDGSNVWMWYAAYHMFDDVLGGRQSYPRWAVDRPWSHNADYARRTYGGSMAREWQRQESSYSNEARSYARETDRSYSATGRRNSSYRPTPFSFSTPGYRDDARVNRSSYAAPQRSARRSSSFGRRR